MATHEQMFDSWLKRYVRAWESNDPKDIGALFGPHANYYTAPYRVPWKGRDGIVRGWLDRKDRLGNWEFRYEILGSIGKMGLVRGWTKYKEPATTYHNLWQVQLEADGTCSEFIEWWMSEEPRTNNG